MRWLRKDNATGALSGNDGAVIVLFPGRARPEPLAFGPIRQEGSLEGHLIRVGGKGETIPVHLRDGAVIHSGLNATTDLARKIAQYLIGHALRVYSSGTWYRQADGSWVLKSFRITGFEVLGDEPLEDVAACERSKEAPGTRFLTLFTLCWQIVMKAETQIDRCLRRQYTWLPLR